jgi:ubiquinone biosynthesis protein Coq4
MNFSTLELILISTQVLLIPLAQYFVHQQKKEITNEIVTMLTEHYMSLESLIDNNKDNINRLHDDLKHRTELSKIKSGILNARIKDIEIYLKKANGFQTRQMNELDDSGFL